MTDDNTADLGALFGAADATSFLGLETCDDLTAIDASSAFVGAPCATPYGSVGAYARNGPASLRRAIAALTSNVDRHNFDLGGPTFPDGCRRAVDCGDLPWHDSDFAANRATIRDAIATIAGRGTVPILIGGDDSVPIPMIEAMGQVGSAYTILQIDAHIDWRDSHMGETHGLSSTMRRASELAHIERIIQVGARGIGSGHSSDLEDARAWGAHFFTGPDIHRHGLAPALEQIPKGAKIILCIDIDAMDPSIAPNTIGRSPGGLSYYQMLDLISGAAARGRIAAVDFVEILPEADIDGIGGLTVSRLVAATMGLIARQDGPA
ncbi:MAG: arginase family protein [Marinibacterium sp.]|nr:arginase family protein [Marinibacterium sp.]